MKLKLKNLGSLIIDQAPEMGKEYLLSIRIERSGESIDRRDPDAPEITYNCTYLATESLVDLGTKKPIRVQNGRTASQKIKWALEELAVKKGRDPEEYYEEVQAQRLAKIIQEIEGISL